MQITVFPTMLSDQSKNLQSAGRTMSFRAESPSSRDGPHKVACPGILVVAGGPNNISQARVKAATIIPLSLPTTPAAYLLGLAYHNSFTTHLSSQIFGWKTLQRSFLCSALSSQTCVCKGISHGFEQDSPDSLFVRS